MRISAEKKKSILLYILQKIDQGEMSIQESVSEAYSIDRATVYKYIAELSDKGLIEKIKRGRYKLKTNSYRFNLKKYNVELDYDTYAFEKCLKPYIKDMDSNVIGIWNYVISEIYNNVIDHSRVENVSITVLQNTLKTTVILSDDSIGIFRKIQEYFKLPTIEDAIVELLKGKLTNDSVNHSGKGIFFSSKMMDEFYIISDGRVFTNNKYDISALDEYSAKNTNGTCVIMRLSNYTNKKYADIFDYHADVDGGFTKTVIPLKNMFETYLVSRSQAKRLNERLTEFK